MYGIVGSPKSVEDLSGKVISDEKIDQLRPKIKILAIDDNGFAQKENLSKHSYNVTWVDDLDSIDFVETYNVILCDINGVGKKLGFDSGGLLIKEIKKRYPMKYVVAYSAGTFEPEYNKYFNLADMTIKKDIDLDDWIDRLDTFTKALANPITQWKRARKHLLEAGVRLELLMHLEDEFVQKSEKSSELQKWNESRTISKLAPEVRSILKDLIVGIIVAYVSPV